MDDDDGDGVGLRTSRCAFSKISSSLDTMWSDEKDRRVLARREYDVARILGKPGGFYMFQCWWSRSKKPEVGPPIPTSNYCTTDPTNLSHGELCSLSCPRLPWYVWVLVRNGWAAQDDIL